jgi:hypothetical protein
LIRNEVRLVGQIIRLVTNCVPACARELHGATFQRPGSGTTRSRHLLWDASSIVPLPAADRLGGIKCPF